MSGRVSGGRSERVHLATALLGRRLEPWVFDVVDELVDELTDNSGTLPDSSLFTPRVVRAIMTHSGYALMRHTAHALSLARLATLLAPHLPSNTPYAAQRVLFLEGEAYRLYTEGLFRCGRNYDALRAAEEARRLFRIPIVAKFHPKSEYLLDLTAGQIVFHLDEMERGLAIVSRAGDLLRDRHHDITRFLKARQIVGSLLLTAHRFEEALLACEEVLDFPGGIRDVELKHAVVYNVAVCGKRLQRDYADECSETALKLLKKSGISGDVPRSGWTDILDLLQRGKTNTAISEMYKFRQRYIDGGNALLGHCYVTPSIVEELVGEGRFSEAHKVGEEAIRELSAAGLKLIENHIRRTLKAAPPEGGAALEHGV